MKNNKSRKSKKPSSRDEDGEQEKSPGKISPHDGDNRPKANGPTDLEPGEISLCLFQEYLADKK